MLRTGQMQKIAIASFAVNLLIVTQKHQHGIGALRRIDRRVHQRVIFVPGHSAADCIRDMRCAARERQRRGSRILAAFLALAALLLCLGLRWRYVLTLPLSPLKIDSNLLSASDGGLRAMCRNIKMLFNFDPPVTPDEIQAASLQFVRKISGFNKPSKANEAAFFSAIDAISNVSANLLKSLETNSPPKNRGEEAARLKARSAKRFGDKTI